MASPTNRQKNRGIITLLARSMPPPMPRAMMSSVPAIAATCQPVLPQGDAAVSK